MSNDNAIDSLQKKMSKLVELTFDTEELAMVANELSALARYLELEIELNDGSMNKVWIEQAQARVKRLRDIARAIVLASQ